MKKASESGWLMSLSSGSNWGSVMGLLHDIESCPKVEGAYILESVVWGKIGAKELQPTKGQGIALYHSTHADFPKPDPHRGVARITAIGKILDVTVDGRSVTYLKVAIDPKHLKALSKHPVLRADEMVEVFEECGIKRGAVATYYFADPAHWKQITASLV